MCVCLPLTFSLLFYAQIIAAKPVQLQRERHEPLRFLQLIQSLVVHSAVPDACCHVAELFLQSVCETCPSGLHVGERGFCAHLRDLQQLFGPVELFSSGFADLDESMNDLEDALDGKGGLLQEHLQSSSQTLLFGLCEGAVLLLEEIEELEIEGEGLVSL